jgi:hypothetical protein
VQLVAYTVLSDSKHAQCIHKTVEDSNAHGLTMTGI